jgi:hypothetical protein
MDEETKVQISYVTANKCENHLSNPVKGMITLTTPEI